MHAPNMYEGQVYEQEVKASEKDVIYTHGSFDDFAQTQNPRAFAELYQQIVEMQAGGTYEQSNPMLEAGFAFTGPPMDGMF